MRVLDRGARGGTRLAKGPQEVCRSPRRKSPSLLLPVTGGGVARIGPPVTGRVEQPPLCVSLRGCLVTLGL